MRSSAAPGRASSTSGAERPPVAQGDPDPGQQLGHRERLGQVVVGAHVERRRSCGPPSSVGGEDDDRDVCDHSRMRRHTSTPSMSGRPRSRITTSTSSTAVVERSGRRRRDPDRRSRGLEAARRARGPGPRRRRRRARVASGRTGRSTANVAPPPGCSDAAMVPPWASTMLRQIARPTPLELLPVAARERLEDAGPHVGGRPRARGRRPRCRDPRRHRLALARDPTPPGGEWRAAFSSRFVSTWSNWL